MFFYEFEGDEQHCGDVARPVFGVYLAACGGSAPCLLILVLFVLNVGSAGFCHWWLSFWINQGSGVRLLLIIVSSLHYVSSTSDLILQFFQNITVTAGNSSTTSIGMRDNPMMQQYVAIYASSMGVMLLLKLLRGVVFVKVRSMFWSVFMMLLRHNTFSPPEAESPGSPDF